MKIKSRPIILFAVLFGYVLLQFMWWEFLLVKQNDRIIFEKQKQLELSIPDENRLIKELEELHHRKNMQTVMIVGEGTVFLLLLLFGVYRIKLAHDKENYLNKQQQNFFLSITHELKTPIAATKLQLQTLQKQNLDKETQQQLIRNALLENERLNELIDNVLFASRLESNEFAFTKHLQDLSACIEQTLKRYYSKEIASGELSFQIEPNLLYEFDSQAFPSVITNLVGNAIKYSGEKKEVFIRLNRLRDKLKLSVTDNGVGISDKDKKNIFSKFFRAGNEETRSSQGTGLGLYIVQYIVTHHKASIAVKDNQPNGTIFEITFHAT